MHVRRALVLAALAATAALATPAQATPGGVFVTGHDPDFHSIAGNTEGARNILRRATTFVTGGTASPTVLIVSSRIPPPGGHLDSVTGIGLAGLGPADVAAAPGQGVLDLTTVDFAAYDAIVVASDFGGILRQAELDILNARTDDLIDFINDGGGLVVLAESSQGARLTPHGRLFDFLPFLATELSLPQAETDYTVTPFGLAMGLTNADVNGNFSHNVFTTTGGMEVVDRDAAGRIMSLAIHGKQICRGGVPAVSIADHSHAEGHSGTTPFTFPVTLDLSPCGGDVSVPWSTEDGTATGGSDFQAGSGSLTFTPTGPLQQVITVGVFGDHDFEADETFGVKLGSVLNATIADGSATGTIVNDDEQNRAPDCSTVTTTPAQLWPPNHKLHLVTLTGGSDPDGDPIARRVTGVTQDEPLDGTGDGDTSPDAVRDNDATVRLRAERRGGGDGRVYAIAYEVTDGQGGVCTGTARVTVGHDQGAHGGAVDSGTTFDSFG